MPARRLIPAKSFTSGVTGIDRTNRLANVAGGGIRRPHDDRGAAAEREPSAVRQRSDLTVAVFRARP